MAVIPYAIAAMTADSVPGIGGRKTPYNRGMAVQHLHISYVPENGWVLTIMTRLLNSPDPQLRKAFESWSDTPLMELGFAITTRMHMLGLCIRRLNRQVSNLRDELSGDLPQVEWSLAKRGAFTLKDKEPAVRTSAGHGLVHLRDAVAVRDHGQVSRRAPSCSVWQGCGGSRPSSDPVGQRHRHEMDCRAPGK